jgi:hypothetical protein
MKRVILLIILFAGLANAALAQNPALSVRLNVADNAGGAQDLFFGLDKNATNGLDAGLGENELPPFPPTGVFEARFIGNDIGMTALGLGTYRDYRTGDLSFNGTMTHEIKYQASAGGSSVQISWFFPKGVTGVLQDLLGGVVVNQAMSANGSYTVANLAIDKLKLTITYNNVMTAVREAAASTPAAFALWQNYPNPFSAIGNFGNPETMIQFDLPQASKVHLEIYNLAGEKVATLIDGPQPAGRQTVRWNGRDDFGRDIASGVYFYRLAAGAHLQTRRMVLLR